MTEKTDLANDILSNDPKPRYDAACKKLFAHKEILAPIMKAYLSEFQDCSLLEIIRKVYSIWVCPAPHKGWENTVNKCEIKESCLVGNQEERPEHYDLMTMILICLGGEDYPRYDGVLELLDVLLSVEKQATEKLDIVEKKFSIPMTRELELEVKDMCDLSTIVEEKGMQKGMQEGILESIVNVMDSLGFSVEQAMNALKVSEDKKPGYEEMLKRFKQ